MLNRKPLKRAKVSATNPPIRFEKAAGQRNAPMVVAMSDEITLVKTSTLRASECVRVCEVELACVLVLVYVLVIVLILVLTYSYS